MNYDCPKCQSDKTQKFSSIYSSQTTYKRSSSTGDVNGVLVGGQGAAVITGLSSTTTHSTSQSQLAAQLSPPVKKPEQWKLTTFVLSPILGSLLWALVSAIYANFNHYGFTGGGGVLAYFVITGMLAYYFWSTASKNKTYNRETYAKQMKVWNEQFFCHRCENIFVPSAK